MIPQTQEFLHCPEQGIYGDCQRAVISSLLGLPLTEVPHFYAESKGEPSVFWPLLQSFLRKYGYVYLTVPACSGAAFFGTDDEVYHEISGPSPRGNGVTHAVIGKGGRVFFDPHPSRAGLAGDPTQWEYSYLVRLDADVTSTTRKNTD